MALPSKNIRKTSGDPVFVDSGVVFHSAVDFELPGFIPLKWERHYYTSSDYEGPLGYGWHHTFDRFITVDPVEGQTILRLCDGRDLFFSLLETGEEEYNRQEKMSLLRDEEGYILKDRGMHLRFSLLHASGKYVLKTVTRPSGQQIRLEYNQQDQLIRIIDSAGRLIRIEHNAEGLISGIYLPHPDQEGEEFRCMAYEYDEQGNQVAAIDALDHAERYVYEGHLLTRKIHRNDYSYSYEYDGTDSAARCIHGWGDGGILERHFEYQEGLTIVENSLGHKTKYYHRDGVVYKEVDPLGGVKHTEFNEFFELASETNELGYTTYYGYDEKGNQSSKFFPDGTSQYIEYNEYGMPINAIDQVDGIWSWDYDGEGRITRRSDPMGGETFFEYEEKTGLVSIIDPIGGKTLKRFDSSGSLVQVITPDGASSKWEYDRLGRMIRSVDPKGNMQIIGYDNRGQITFEKHPDGYQRIFSYDEDQNLSKLKDEDQEIYFEYQGRRLLKSHTIENARIEFRYDKEERLNGIFNEFGLLYEFDLDPNGNLRAETGFDNRKRVFQRDAAGQVEKLILANGIEVFYEYDLMGRTTNVLYSTGEEERYLYRRDGELIEASNGNSIVSFKRDLIGRVLEEVQNGISIESKIDPIGLRVQISSSLGANLKISRDNMGDVLALYSDANVQPWAVHYKRDLWGLELEKIFPGDVKSLWERDNLGRPLKHQVSKVGNRLIGSREYFWSNGHKLERLVDFGKKTTDFRYDSFGNLESAIHSNDQDEFRFFDLVGNLFQKPDFSDSKYGFSGELLESMGRVYEYDEEGNLIRKTESNGNLWKYYWNGAGMLSSVIRPDGKEVRFSYDALGRRQSKSYQGTITYWVWDGNVPLHEWTEKDNNQEFPTSSLFNKPGQIKSGFNEVREVDCKNGEMANSGRKDTISGLITWYFEPETFSPLARVVDGNYYSIQVDHLGSPILMHDYEGGKVWASEIDTYGNLSVLEGGKDFCPFRFPGQYEDKETGLYYNRFRYYDPEIGGYISKDPIRLIGGLHQYRYVSNPKTITDFFGLHECWEIKDNFPPGSFESKQLRRFVEAWNEEIQKHGGSMTRRSLTAAEEAASNKWKKEMRKRFPGRFRNKVVGHTPDAGAGGVISGGRAMALDPRVNASIGGQVSSKPVGYTYNSVRVVRA